MDDQIARDLAELEDAERAAREARRELRRLAREARAETRAAVRRNDLAWVTAIVLGVLAGLAAIA